MTIPTWRERVVKHGRGSRYTVAEAMQSEIDDLRTTLATIERETIERIIEVCRDNDCYRAITAIRAMKKGATQRAV